MTERTASSTTIPPATPSATTPDIETASFSALSGGLREWLCGRGSTPPWHPPTDICLRVLGAVCALGGDPLGPRGWGPCVRVTDDTADAAFARLLALCGPELRDSARAPMQDMGMPRSVGERGTLAALLPHLADAWASGRRALAAYDDAWNRKARESAELHASVARILQPRPQEVPSDPEPPKR